MLLQSRRSGFNVKRFERNWVNVNADNLRFNDEAMENYYSIWQQSLKPGRRSVVAFGAKAQRKVVVQALQSLVNGNEDIRDDESQIV